MATSGHALVDRRCRLTVAVPVSTPNDFKNTTTDVIEIAGGVSDDRLAAGMRIQFKIIKTLKKEPNSCEIIVTNLAPKTRASLQQKGVKVLLEAGYRDTGVFRVFSGDVRTVDHTRNGPDWETVLHLGDGERAWNFARVSESFGPDTSASDVIRKLVDKLGLKSGNVDKRTSQVTKKFGHGFTAHGATAAVLDQVVRSIGLNWSVQDGEFQLLGPDEVLDLPVPEITPTSGLVGSPEMGSPTKKGKPALVKFKALLTPTKPGSKVKLKSERYDSYVRVESCTFTGDTHGGDWYTEISASIIK